MKKTWIKPVMLVASILVILMLLTGCGLKNLKIKKVSDDKTDIIEDDIDKILEDDLDIVDELEEIEEIDEIIEDEVEEEAPKIPIKEVIEGDLVNFPNLKATDPDGDKITYSFTSPLDTTGKWQTRIGDAGNYRVTITASDGKNKVSQEIMIVVNPKNKPPILELDNTVIKVKEGEIVQIDVDMSDPDGDKLTISFSGWMNSAKKLTTYSDAGTHTVIIEATDGKVITSKDVTVIVENVNRAPVLEKINDIIVKEGDKITLSPFAEDPDNDKITYKYSEQFDMAGVWQTEKGDAGNYRVTVTATDGDLTDEKEFYVLVETLNKAPVIQVAKVIEVDEGEIAVINADITDPEDDELTIKYSGWMTSDTYQTTYEDSGVHKVTITVSDGMNTAKETIKIVVNDMNRVPVFDPGAFN